MWANVHETRDSISLISYARCLGISSVISAQFALEMCVIAWNRETFTKTPYFVVQGRSRSSVFAYPVSSSAVLVVIISKSLSICNCSQYNKWWNDDFLGGTPRWCPRSMGSYVPSGTKFTHKKLETLSYHTVKPGVSISPGLESAPGRDRQRDRQTDRHNYDG